MKRILAVVLSLVLTVCLLSGCNENANNNSAQMDDFDGAYQGFETGEGQSSETTTNDEPVTSGETTTSIVSEASSMNEFVELPSRIEYDSPTNFNLSEFKEGKRQIKVLQDATAEDFKTYSAELLSKGFTKYDENKIADSLFMTLASRDTFVSISYMASDRKLKVVSEPLGDLYPRASDNKYKSLGLQSLFTGMKNQNKPIYSGMGFIIRLDDGSFIIIDGGGGDRNHIDSNNLLNILKEQSPKGTDKPVIAAWIFTHCHDDHIGVFNAFSNDFHDKVEIKQIYYSFPMPKDILEHASYMFDDDYYSYPQFENIIKNYYSNADIIRPHSGERYYIKNAVIEMLFTYDDHFPHSYEGGELGDLNTTSLIFTVEIGGQKMMITGDAEESGMFKVLDNFGDHIKCDILQLSHHGQNGTVSFYSAVNPKYVLVPISHVDTNRVYKNSANKWLVNNRKGDEFTVRQFIAFWSGNVTIPLPYNPTDSQIYDRIPTADTRYYDFQIN